MQRRLIYDLLFLWLPHPLPTWKKSCLEGQKLKSDKATKKPISSFNKRKLKNYQKPKNYIKKVKISFHFYSILLKKIPKFIYTYRYNFNNYVNYIHSILSFSYNVLRLDLYRWHTLHIGLLLKDNYWVILFRNFIMYLGK